MRRVAVTGATGYVGRALSRALDHTPGTTVRVLTRQPGVAVADGHESVIGTIERDADCERLVRDADVVIHAAGVVRSQSVDTNWEINVEGTRRLLRASEDAGVRRFVYVSSTGVYGRPSMRVDEESPDRPIGPYERSKAAAEAFVRRAPLSDVVIAQPSNIIGAGHPERPLRRLLGMIRSGKPILHAGAWTNYVDVGFVAQVIVALAITPEPPRTVIINDPMPLDRFAEIAGHVVGRRPRTVALPSVLRPPARTAVRILARQLSRLDRFEALVDETRFVTIHGGWFQESALAPRLGDALLDMAEEYGLR